jgi:hypothetical protein
MVPSRLTTRRLNAHFVVSPLVDAYLFAGADSGGERGAAIYSLIGTAKLNGVDPEAWLRLSDAYRRSSR